MYIHIHKEAKDVERAMLPPETLREHPSVPPTVYGRPTCSSPCGSLPAILACLHVAPSLCVWVSVSLSGILLVCVCPNFPLPMGHQSHWTKVLSKDLILMKSAKTLFPNVDA